MNFRWKSALRAIAILGAACVLPGCGGVSGSHSVSPATFLLPGLVQTPDSANPGEIPPPAPDIVAGGAEAAVP
ncbi:MAG: hypothetical protein FJ404_09200 [Verrucomicrobia bacterium]|nr:hypothetical protein [Verrucomicrobiota bacterium]